jgi:glycosyltransferase involved in cell wall biosynthesis
MSLVVLEAQACGKLVLASDIPASRELIRDGETGLLFPVGDAAGLAATMLRAADDPRLRASIGDAARREAQGRTLKKMINHYAAALKEIVHAG